MRSLDVVVDPGAPIAWMGAVFLLVLGALLVLGGATGLAALEGSGRLRRMGRSRKTGFAAGMLALVVVGFALAAFALMARRFGFVAPQGAP